LESLEASLASKRGSSGLIHIYHHATGDGEGLRNGRRVGSISLKDNLTLMDGGLTIWRIK
jgi:hypothetical protein